MKRLKAFLEDSGCFVYEMSHTPEKPMWRNIAIELHDGKYSVSLPSHISERKMIVEFSHDDILACMEEYDDDADNDETLHGEIREIIVSLADEYFYPREVAAALYGKKAKR